MVTISEQLTDTVEGIVCVTPSNASAPWLNYEAGALAKTTGQTAVRTALLGLKPSDIPSGLPLSNFQHTNLLDKDEMWSLVQSIHDRAPEEGEFDLARIQWAFDMAWDQLQIDLSAVDLEDAGSPSVEPRDEKALIQDLLDEVRELSLAIANLTESSKKQSPDSDTQAASARRQEADARKAEFANSIHTGMQVEHSSFGIGDVISVERSGRERTAKVKFSSVGEKRLLLRYAPLKIVE